ncbi:TCR/Tet family MFS transporter [Thalassovita sp.]|uniref:TCR/Tet family MFS transporter n=1 Tax=Thalassovita sp. TaxID=1979401 RepID=UPI0029DE89A7|nr:TCR/Tet family MFS transporter [Thalassovita sp.]
MTNRLPVLFILITVMIDAMGIGLIMPVMPELIQEVSGGTLARAALWGGVLTTSFALMQFLFSPALGRLSDAYGRRPVLLVSLVVMAADYLVMALAGSIWLLLAGRIVGGITAATHATAMAYMADISSSRDKAANFGLIGAGFGVGFVLGPMLGGLLAEYGTRAPFYAAAALALANAVFGYSILKETVTAATRRPFRRAGANPFSAFRALTHMGPVSPILGVIFLYHLANVVYPAIWAYFTTARFGWSPGLIGVSLAVYGVSMAVIQGGLIRPAIRFLGEARTALLGLGIEVVALLLVAFVPDGRVVMALIPISALGAIGLPALQGILSRIAPDDAQGELQGVLSSIGSVAMIVGPLMMTQVFALFTGTGAPFHLPGAPFVLAAALMTVGMALFAAYRHRLRHYA